MGYDIARHLLKVRFRNGRTYYYLDVPRETYRRLMTAESLGKFINEEIKPKYKAVRVPDAKPPNTRRKPGKK